MKLTLDIPDPLLSRIKRVAPDTTPHDFILLCLEAEVSGLEGTLHVGPEDIEDPRGYPLPPCPHVYYGHDREDGKRVRKCRRCGNEVEI